MICSLVNSNWLQIQDKIGDLINKSFALRRKSKRLLEQAEKSAEKILKLKTHAIKTVPPAVVLKEHDKAFLRPPETLIMLQKKDSAAAF
jgi:hypothetical protein